MVKGLLDISDYDGAEDEAFPPLPPPHSPSLGGQEDGDPFTNGEEDGDVSKLAEVPAAKRKGVKRPQPKLDSNRLTSERGLPALRTLFDNVHFKGKGHEAEDLRLLMQKMENWAHRLFPKLQFEDFIDKVEKLGTKKEVQTCLKRIRLDMPLTHEDFIGEEAAAPESHIFGDPDPFSSGSFPDELSAPVHSTPAPAAPPTPAATPSLTEEQRKRMELNRQRALERRLARQQQQPADPSDSQSADTSLLEDGPSAGPVINNSRDQEEEEEEEKKKEEREDEEDEKTEEREDEEEEEKKKEEKKMEETEEEEREEEEKKTTEDEEKEEKTEEMEDEEEEKKKEEREEDDFDLQQPSNSSTQQAEQLPPRDSEPSEQ